MSDEFFNGLKSKLKHEPSKDFDKDFWKGFNDEFSNKSPSKFWTFWMVPASVAAMLLMGVVFYNSATLETERVTIGAAVEDEDILQNMELLMHIDDEVLDVAHEEWDELLEEGQS